MAHETQTARTVPPGLPRAWIFSEVLPGTFRRNRRNISHRSWPLVGPEPDDRALLPKEGRKEMGPFIYFLANGRREVKYVGKSFESAVLKRWARPDTSGSLRWSHGTTSANGTATVERIAEELARGSGPVTLYFIGATRVRSLMSEKAMHLSMGWDSAAMPFGEDLIESVEAVLIDRMRSPWNSARPRLPSCSLLKTCAPWWTTY